MAHRRVKDVSYDDDDLDDYVDTHEDDPQSSTLSAEDEEQMRAGTISVRQGLGDIANFTTDKEIQDALWYYYYDVEKSVGYLRKQKVPDEPRETQPHEGKKQKQTAGSRFEQAAEKAQASGILWSSHWSYIPEDFFADTPFLAVAPHRIGTLTPPLRRPLPRGGLLGGSSTGGSGTGKPSKLATLAAKRKQAAEDKKKQEAEFSDEQSNSSLRMLDRLGKRQRTDSVGAEETRQQVESLSIDGPDEGAGPAAADVGMQDTPRQYRRQYPTKKPSEPQLPTAAESGMEPQAKAEDTDEPSDEAVKDLSAAPSIFASSLFAPNVSRHSGNQESDRGRFAIVPATSDISSQSGDPFSGPSPDDVVIRAQQGKGAKPNPAPVSKKTLTKDVTNGVKKLNVNGDALGTPSQPAQPKVKSKNIDVAAEFAKQNSRRSANFVVIGHVDHGKSTLMGRLLHDTDFINSRDFTKLSASASAAGKGSFNYAWLMDSTAEERSRGITVDIAHTSFSVPATDSYPAVDFNILDAPGHKDFVPNMIAGAAQADFALLVTDASGTEFEKGLEGGGQTKEHALLIRGLGVQRVVVAVNKMDTINWNQSRYQDIEGQIGAFLAKIGFKKDDIRVVPCAGLTGENIVFRNPLNAASETSKSASKSKSTSTTTSATTTPSSNAHSDDNMSWYTGPTLLQHLSNFTPQSHNLTKPFRMTISDIFRSSVTNPLSISGRLDAGTIQIGEQVLCMPSGETATVRGIETTTTSSSASGTNSTQSTNDEADTPPGPKPTPYATAGQIATLHLQDIDPVHLKLGDVLCSPQDPVRNCAGFVAKVLAFEHLIPGAVDCHRGRLHCSAQVSKLLGLVEREGGSGGSTSAEQNGNEDMSSGKKRKLRIVKPGQVARVKVDLETPLPLEVGIRIVLRSEGVTVAAGLVEGVDVVVG